MNKQHVGYRTNPENERLGAPHQRKAAERGYLICLGLVEPKAMESGQRLAARALLALLDGQPGSRHERLFRGTSFDHHRRWDEFHWCGVSQPPDRLAGDEMADLEFVISVAREQGVCLCRAFLVLYKFIEARGGDTRPVWRRRTNLPWPYPPNLLDIGEVAELVDLPRQAIKKLARSGQLPVAGRVSRGRQRGDYLLFWREDVIGCPLT